jgi:hypothetical protein
MRTLEKEMNILTQIVYRDLAGQLNRFHMYLIICMLSLMLVVLGTVPYREV